MQCLIKRFLCLFFLGFVYELMASGGKHPVFIQAIQLVADAQELQTIPFEEGIHCSDEIQNQQKFEQSLEPFLGKRVEAETLLNIKQQILATCQELNQTFITVQIPEQEISSGTLSLILSPSVLGEVAYEGNRWFSDALLAKRIPLQSGEVIDETQLLDDVAWMNRNPFHHSELIFAPGTQIRSTDVKIATVDRFPLSVYNGFDNTGTTVTGDFRCYAGCNWGNAFWNNDLLVYQFTASDQVQKFTSHYLNYTSFLPWKNTLNIAGIYSTIRPESLDFRQEGTFAQLSCKYEVPIGALYTPFQSQWGLGADCKFLNTNLFFVDQADQAPLAKKAVTVFQFVGSYQLENHFSNQDLFFQLEMISSIFEAFPHQSKADFDALRPKASPLYSFLRSNLSYDVGEKTAFSFSSLLRGQIATGALLSSEQFGLGGYDTVRGYDERIYLADDAIALNLEVKAPRIQFGKRFDHEMIFLAFSDFGWGRNHSQSGDEPLHEYLWGIGPGVRFNIPPYFTTRIDYGFCLHEISLQSKSLGKIHFSLSGRY